MHPTDIEKYNSDGYLLMDQLFNQQEIDLIKSQIPALTQLDKERVILEKSGAIRTIFIADHTNDFITKLIRVKKLLSIAETLLHDKVYPHQIKLNAKIANAGDVWDWHQDFTYWHIEDGMPTGRALNAAIFLDEVNEFNGPMFLVPKSHYDGIVDGDGNHIDADQNHSSYKGALQDKPYLSTLTASLKYTIKNENLSMAIAKNGIVSSKGKPGSVLLFHPSVMHASPPNLSPWNRLILFVTYNSTSNHLLHVEKPRPLFIANRNFKSLIAIPNESLNEIIQQPL